MPVIFQQPKAIRKALKAFELSSAHKAIDLPDLKQIYAPAGHAEALDPERALVVGGRGVGKSYWAAVLNSKEGRNHVAREYPKLSLDRVYAALGFHEAARGSKSIAPSPPNLKKALAIGAEPLIVWQAVLARALDEQFDVNVPTSFFECIDWIEDQPDEFEDILVKIDGYLNKTRRRFLLVFDALDRLAQDWGTIRRLTRGAASLALDLRGTKAIRAKIFMRRDQFEDEQTMVFPDSSKLRTAAVKLDWSRIDLYGFVFSLLWQHEDAGGAMRLYYKQFGQYAPRSIMPTTLKQDEDLQQRFFSKIAGEFMGANHRRGRTYSWLHSHLADAFGETSPRSFLIALRRAAENAAPSLRTAIDHHGIREGVVEASRTRVAELQEDHPWVRNALSALSDLTVPCQPSVFIKRWKEHGTINSIFNIKDSSRPTAPVEVELGSSEPEAQLLIALTNLGVVERRVSVGKINVPDIFRVAASLKRLGGVPPRKSGYSG